MFFLFKVREKRMQQYVIPWKNGKYAQLYPWKNGKYILLYPWKNGKSTMKTYLKRNIDPFLQEWKDRRNRKPLLIRGARQVGKSASVVQLGTSFSNFVEINFESLPEIHPFFEGNIEPQRLCEDLSAYLGVPVIPGKTLLFFDEVQACLPAISYLRYFYEKMPELHIIAAGSLLEFVLEDLPSFAVGRIEILYMYTFSFNEFLLAMGEEMLLRRLLSHSKSEQMPDGLHKKLLDYLRRFMIIGGMPEVVSDYVKNTNILSTQKILDSILETSKADFVKYKKRVPSSRLNDVFLSAIAQVSQKFMYSGVSTNANHKQLKEAVELLIKAGMLFPVVHSSGNGIPLGAGSDAKKRKILPYDTGIYLRFLGLELKKIIIEEDIMLVNEGALAELFCGLEIIKCSSPEIQSQLWYWHREAKNSNAEVDYLIQKETNIIPLEVKSRRRGGMKSLRLFMEEKKSSYAYRISSENFSVYENIQVFPLYALWHIFNQ